MANIPVEQTTGTPWWAWLIGLLGLVALIWLGMELFDEEPDADEIAGIENNEGPIDDVDLSDDVDVFDDYEPFDAATMGLAALAVGDDVSVSGLRVTDVMSDKTFMVDDMDDNAPPMLVVLDQEMTPGVAGVEGRYDVNEGQTVTVYGDVERIGADTLEPLGISAAGMDGLSEGDLYLHADRLDISDAELDRVEVE